MQVIYRAYDSKEFDNEWDCQDYEWKLIHPHLKEVVLYDMDGEVMENIFLQDTYENVMKIIVPTDEAAKDIRDLGRYCGFCCYEDIESSGVWKWNEEGCNSKFIKVE